MKALLVVIRKLCLVTAMGLVFYGQAFTQDALPNNSMTWKEAWIKKLTHEYLKYDAQYETICDSTYRHVVFDMTRKIQSILEFPYDVVVSGFRSYIDSLGLQFDSIRMYQLSNPILEPPDYSFPWTWFDVYVNGKVTKYQIRLRDLELFAIEKIREFNSNPNSDSKVMNGNGCEPGFSSDTWFDRDWNWKITRIIINPDNTVRSE